MDGTIRINGRLFTPQLIEHLQRAQQSGQAASRNGLAREVCRALNWCTPQGRLALPQAKQALHKLRKRGLLELPDQGGPRRQRRAMDPELPPVERVPGHVRRVRGLTLYRLSGHEDPHAWVWKALMLQQGPEECWAQVGLRYLVGSEHGWLGALGFGPAAFELGPRDQWIGWSTAARLAHLPEVAALSPVVMRPGVRCRHLLSEVLRLALERVVVDWEGCYQCPPALVESCVERRRATGQALSHNGWRRLGSASATGKGRGARSQRLLDLWVCPLEDQARRRLQEIAQPPLSPQPLLESLANSQWCGQELAGLQLGDERLDQRAQQILQARWEQPRASWYGSFADWSAAKGAYRLLESRRPDIDLESLLSPHVEATQGRMAAEALVLLMEDTTSLNYSGLEQTPGLGSLGENPGHGLWSHNVLACRPDGVPLGLLWSYLWARPEDYSSAGRNAKSIEEKESVRWVESYHRAALAARRMPQSQLVKISDREGDLYELYDAETQAPANLHTLIRAQHDRNLVSHQKLWDYLAQQPAGAAREVRVPRRQGQPARTAQMEVRWAAVTLQAPAVGPKKNWPPLQRWAIWVKEIGAPAGVEPIEWMLLTDLPIGTGEEAWQKVQWYCRRWTIEEWHRVLKSGCKVEERELKSVPALERALAFDLIVAWRVLLMVKLGRSLPQLPAHIIYTPEEQQILLGLFGKKTTGPARPPTLGEMNRSVARLGGYLARAKDGEPGAESLGIGLRRLADMVTAWKLANQKCG
jgi:hypothetical protein